MTLFNLPLMLSFCQVWKRLKYTKISTKKIFKGTPIKVQVFFNARKRKKSCQTTFLQRKVFPLWEFFEHLSDPTTSRIAYTYPKGKSTQPLIFQLSKASFANAFKLSIANFFLNSLKNSRNIVVTKLVACQLCEDLKKLGAKK